MQPFLITMAKKAFKDNMFKRISLIVGSVLLSILLLGYVFRLPLLQWAVAPKLEKAGVVLNCLDFSVTTKLNIHVQSLCLQYQGQQLTFKNITANTQQIEIEQAELVLSNSSSGDNNSPSSPLNLPLIDKRPLVNIKQLLITNKHLSRTLKLSLSEPALNQFLIKGDIEAQAHLSNKLVTGEFKATHSHLKLIANNAIPALQNITFDTQQQFNFDGVNLNLNGLVNAQFSDSYQQCPLQINSAGKLVANFNLNSHAFMLDGRSLTTTLQLASNCIAPIAASDFTNFAIEQLALNWQIRLPEVVHFQNKRLELPVINLASEGDKQYAISITNTKLNVDKPLQSIQSQVGLVMSTPQINSIRFDGQLLSAKVKGDFDLVLKNLPEFSSINANDVTVSGQFALSDFIDAKPIGHIKARARAAKLIAFNTRAVQYQGDVTAKIDELLNAEATLVNKAKSVNYKKYNLTDITNTLSAKANLGVGELFTELAAQTNIEAIESPDITLNSIKIESNGLQSRALQATHHAFVDGIELVVNHHISSEAHPFEVIFPTQSVLPINRFINQFSPLAKLTQGEFNGHVRADVNLQKASFSVKLNKLSALYNDYLASEFNSVFSGDYNSGKLNIKPTTFTLRELRAGAVVNNITGYWQVKNEAKIYNVKGDVFDGSLSLDKYIVGKSSQVANIAFDNIDAGKLVTFNEQSGISVTGRLAGTLPVHFDKKQVSVFDGQLFNQGEGRLKITNNAAFEAVLLQQQELKPILGLLKDLDIQNLKSSVALKDDGWLKLGVNLQGYNKQAKQQVNFNYNHEENVFTLLRALRLSDEITQKVEQQYSQKGNR